ncbi:hypothetical protein CTAYLR_010765 [Chrysophaeum taylorii]|uniref:Serine-threonine kinase receptor-associated protein n=1 Tax=Chrysophaeum taylorii TaxID=2483200 RepID=A0AAD7UB44_9STRA|nr:hypothetical protein CTAYLR_010765 [Chrysophaeum taylorii]
MAAVETTTIEAAGAAPAVSHHHQQPPIVCPGHVRPLAEVHFSGETPDGVFLISACLDGSPMLRDGATGDWIGTFAGHKGAVWSAKVDAEARLAATGSGDFSAKLWDAVTGKCVATLSHGHVVKSVDISGNRATLATAGHEGVVRLFDVATASDVPVRELAVGAQLAKCCWADSDLVVAGASDGSIRVWDTRGPACVVDFALEGGPIMDIELKTAGGRPTMTACCGDVVAVYDAKTWTPRTRVAAPVHFREEGGASLAPSGDRLVLGGGRHGGSRQGALGVEKGATRVGDVGSDLTVFAVDLEGNVVHERKGHCGPVRCVRFHPSGATVATGSEDGTIRIWPIKNATAD